MSATAEKQGSVVGIERFSPAEERTGRSRDPGRGDCGLGVGGALQALGGQGERSAMQPT